MRVVDVAGWEDRAVLRAVEVCAILGVTRQTLYRWSKKGSFPSSVKLGPQARGWLVPAVKEWLAKRPASGL